MYFRSRAFAGRELAEKLEHYRTENVSVVALTPGGVIVGAQIAMRLHANLMMLLTENIIMPGEHEAYAAVSSENTFTYNNMFSTGELEALQMEYRNYIDAQRLEKLHRLHALLGADGEIEKVYLARHNIILVSDGFNNGFSLDIAADFLKPVKIKKLVVACPIASVTAIDRMHLFGDEISCLSVVENFVETNHYYDDNTIPNTEGLIKIIRNLPIHWQRPRVAH
jgi:putative phosphoribosyl transferase